MANIIYIIIGGILGFLTGILWSWLQARQKNITTRQYIKFLESENKLLRDDLKAQVARNSQDIYQLKNGVGDLESQIITCLEILSGISNIKDAEDFRSTYVASRRFFEKWGFKEKDVNPNLYKSD
jgi:hypothetical protein